MIDFDQAWELTILSSPPIESPSRGIVKESGMDALNKVLSELKDFNLTGKVTNVEDTIKASGAYFEIFCGISTVHGCKVAVRRLRLLLQKEPVFTVVRYRCMLVIFDTSSFRMAETRERTEDMEQIRSSERPPSPWICDWP